MLKNKALLRCHKQLPERPGYCWEIAVFADSCRP